MRQQTSAAAVADAEVIAAATEDGRVKAGQGKIGPVKRQLISLWRREMERSFATVAPWIT